MRSLCLRFCLLTLLVLCFMTKQLLICASLLLAIIADFLIVCWDKVSFFWNWWVEYTAHTPDQLTEILQITCGLKQWDTKPHLTCLLLISNNTHIASSHIQNGVQNWFLFKCVFPLFLQKLPPSSPGQKRYNNSGYMGGGGGAGKGYVWKMSCLRPAPPTRCLSTHDNRGSVSKKKGISIANSLKRHSLKWSMVFNSQIQTPHTKRICRYCVSSKPTVQLLLPNSVRP